MSVLEFFESLMEIRCEDISHAETMTGNLVSVCRSDTFQGRTDFALACGSFISSVKKPVSRQDKMSFLGNAEFLFRFDVHLADVSALFSESDRIENHSATDDVGGAVSENS